jgi:hypothetical protein
MVKNVGKMLLLTASPQDYDDECGDSNDSHPDYNPFIFFRLVSRHKLIKTNPNSYLYLFIFRYEETMNHIKICILIIYLQMINYEK